MLCKVHPELYIPPLTQPTNNAPDLYHFTRLGVLCWFEVEQPWMVVCGLIWSGGLVWRWSDVGVDAWSDLWPDLRLVWLSIVVVWSGADLMDCRCGLVPWPNLEDWLRKMVCSDGWKWKIWEANTNEKGLNNSESYVKRNEEKKYGNTSFFKFSCNWKLSCPGKVCKDSIKVIRSCADDLFESFPFVLRIVNCNVHHHGNIPGSAAIFSRGYRAWCSDIIQCGKT